MKNLVKKAGKKVISFFKDIQAIRRFSELEKVSYKSGKKIKVIFIVQLTEIWDKQVAVYESMKKNKNFKVSLLVVPPFDFVNNVVSDDYSDNYFLNNYPEDSIKALSKSGKCINLERLAPDYVFYPRPYDHYLPEKLQSSAVSKYTKCCYIPYGYSGSDNFNASLTDKNFFRNMYFVFPESEYMLKIFKKIGFFRKTTSKNLQHIEYHGYPSLAPYLNMKNSDSIKTVLWTPRWSYAPKIGGSHFLEYKDIFIEEAKKHSDIKFIFRPHPLMFQEFIKNKLMTEQEVEDYVNLLSEANIEYDKDSDFYETAKKSDIMISDYSSVVINMFLAEKPIIYCPSDVVSNQSYKVIEKGMYFAESASELVNHLENLLNGSDPLKKERKAIKKKELDLHMGAADSIVKSISDDYTRHIK